MGPMKVFFAATFGALLALSAVAASLRPAPRDKTKTPLVWVSDDNPARRDQIDLFNARHPRLSLSLDPNNTGLEKTVIQSLAGVGADLFDAGEGSLSVLVDAGVVADITDDLKARGIDIQRDTWKAVQSIVMRDGRVYGVPTNAAADALFLNKDMFEKTGVPFPKGPWTWDQFLPLAKRMTVRDQTGKVVQFGLMVDWNRWTHFVLQWGGQVFSDDGTECVVDSPEAVAGVQFLHDLVYVHKVTPSPVEEAAMATQGGWGSGVITQFGGGRKGAMALGGRWWLCTLRDKKQFPGLRLTAVEAPVHRLDRRVHLGYGKGTFVNANSPRRKEAVDFLVFLMGEEYGQLINDQADGVAPTRKVCYAPAFERNPKFPEEDYNPVWREAMEVSVGTPMSPYVNFQAANRILTRQMDLIKNDQKPVAAALRDAAREVNAEIRRTLDRNPALKRKWEEARAASAAKSAGKTGGQSLVDSPPKPAAEPAGIPAAGGTR